MATRKLLFDMMLQSKDHALELKDSNHALELKDYALELEKRTKRR
jgi:hypothetical protein